jgi:hypothetical protein
MLTITYSERAGEIVAAGRSIRCWSKVRNEINGLRPKAGAPDIFRITRSDGTAGVPSMPRPFPSGTWKITAIKPHPDKTDSYLYPFFIATDAHQRLETWRLDDAGYYKAPTGIPIDDYAYGLHFSSSDWTQGCIRIEIEDDLRYLVDLIRPRLGREFIHFIAT